ncbi:type II toxin-antitoxin system Phd/YefM family antitoxin [Mycobacterium sp. SA01]|uniref:type II toxin-antitoxin system Phd/YefM family antitoxin n=1 Tax=Mycobacterium sp. SA01 TaxID=3238820 RepID=UPI00351B41D6
MSREDRSAVTTGKENSKGGVIKGSKSGQYAVVSGKPSRGKSAIRGSSLPSDRMVPVSEARANLSALIKRAADGDLFLMNHGRPAAVLMSPEHYQSLLEELDDLQDRLAVWENADAPAVPFEHVLAELPEDDAIANLGVGVFGSSPLRDIPDVG